jgi:hypothetical protein
MARLGVRVLAVLKAVRRAEVTFEGDNAFQGTNMSDQKNVTVQVEKLVADGLVVRRGDFARLTAAGIEALDNA